MSIGLSKISKAGASVLHYFRGTSNDPRNYSPEVLSMPQQVAVHISKGDSLVSGLWVTFEEIRAMVSPEASWRPTMASCLSCFGMKGRAENEEFPPAAGEILRGISGQVKPGQLLAILGSSGSGKSTFLNYLAGYPLRGVETSGEVKFGGMPVTSDERQAICGYVQQKDLFLPYLTVGEHLRSQAFLRLTRMVETEGMERVERKLTKEEILSIVDKTLIDFNLKKIENVFIGEPGQGISGGERKRLAVAVECLSKPAVLICDEPTSGSDAFTAANIIRLLENVAQAENKAVILTVHQPSSHLYHSFTKVLFLANGRVAYYGKPEKATDFFGSLGFPCPERFNPADYFINLLTVQNSRTMALHSSRYGVIKTSTWHDIEGMCQAFADLDPRVGRQMHIFVKPVDPVPRKSILKMFSHKQASWSRQMRVLLERNRKCVWRHPRAYMLDLFTGFLMAIIAGIIYTNKKPTEQFDKTDIFNINGAIWYFIILNGILFVSKIIHYSFEEFPNLLREQSRRLYSVWAYFLAKNAFDLPARILFPLISSCSLYYWIGLRWDDFVFRRYPIFCAYLIAHTIANSGYAYALGALFLDEKVASQISHFTNLLLYTVGGGFFINIRTLPAVLSWVPYMSWYFYTAEGLYSNQWVGATFDCYVPPNATQLESLDGSWVLPENKAFYIRASSSCPFPHGEAILDMLAMNGDNVYRNLWILAVFIVVLRLLGGVFLSLKVYRSLK